MSNGHLRAALGLACGALLVIGAGCGAAQRTNVEVGAPQAAAPSTDDTGVTIGADVAVETEANVKEVHVTASQFRFVPAEVRVKEGERVRLVATTEDVAHGIAIPAFNVSLNVEPGAIASAEFVADKKGSYPFFCNVFCGSGHGQMRGTLIVE